MSETIVLGIVSGVSGAAVLLLGAIWSEMRSLNDKLQQMAIDASGRDQRIETCEKLIDKLPCLNNIVCPNNRAR